MSESQDSYVKEIEQRIAQVEANTKATRELIEGRLEHKGDELVKLVGDQSAMHAQQAREKWREDFDELKGDLDEAHKLLRDEFKKMLDEFVSKDLPHTVEELSQARDDKRWERVRKRVGTIALVGGVCLGIAGWLQDWWLPLVSG